MDFVTFFFGCIGALSPEILRLYRLRSRSVKFSRFYLLISVLFSVTGGIVALAVSSTTIWGSFYSGLSLPILISGALGKVPERAEMKKRLLGSENSKLGISTKEFLGILFQA